MKLRIEETNAGFGLFEDRPDEPDYQTAVCNFEDDAEHIVRCVNAHDALVAIAQEIATSPTTYLHKELRDIARAALAAAEEK